MTPYPSLYTDHDAVWGQEGRNGPRGTTQGKRGGFRCGKNKILRRSEKDFR